MTTKIQESIFAEASEPNLVHLSSKGLDFIKIDKTFFSNLVQSENTPQAIGWIYLLYMHSRFP